MTYLSGPLQAQTTTTPWNAVGSSIWYAPPGINVGIGTSGPSDVLTVFSPAPQVAVFNSSSVWPASVAAVDGYGDVQPAGAGDVDWLVFPPIQHHHRRRRVRLPVPNLGSYASARLRPYGSEAWNQIQPSATARY
jgi:hypothetical protein